MKEQPHIHPPHWPLKLLRLFLKKEYVEEIEGDMEETFFDYAAAHSLRKARWMYAREAIELLRPVLLKKNSFIAQFQQPAMFKNYIKTSFRNLSRNPLTSFINVFGLSVAIGICLVVYAFIEYDYSIDQFHKNKDEIYLTTFFSNREGASQQYGLTPRPLAEVLKQDFPQIKHIARIEDRNAVLKQGDQVFHERVRYTDADFLAMFTFPLKWGTAGSLAELNNIILSEDMSRKYFGEENSVGREILMILDDGTKKAFTVSGVAEEFPKARDIDFNFLVNFQNLVATDRTYDLSDWGQFVNATFVQVENSSALYNMQRGLDKYLRLQNQAQPDWAASSFVFESLATLHSKSANIRDGITHDDNVEGRIGMPIIAIFMIALACFNYINMAIVSAAKRLKEIGVRKAIGANRGRVIVQFLTENVAITFFALLIGIALSVFVFIPWFVQFSGWPLELKMLNGNLWIFLVGLLFFTGIASGIYPAFYISRFDAVRIFRGSLQFGKKNPLTKVFLSVQLVLACITITAGVVFTQNNRFQNSRSWGYNHTETFFAGVHDSVAFERLRTEMVQVPGVISIAGSKDHLGRGFSKAIMRTPAHQQYEAQQFLVDAKYFETMGLQLASGRAFVENAETDRKAIVVNELLVKNFNLSEPIGQQFEIDSVKYEVIGVVKDFHTRNFFNKVEPAIFKLANKESFQYLSMRVEPGSENEVRVLLQQKWAKLYPEIPFQGGHQQEVWASYFHSVNRSERFNKVIASIAVLLASLGLYGLVTLNVSGRVKEFSIRRTLGAGVTNITSVILKQYSALVIIALMIGAPVSFIFTKAYLDMLFAYPMPMDYTGISLALVILVFILLAVVSTQIRKVVKLNPVHGLKAE